MCFCNLNYACHQLDSVISLATFSSHKVKFVDLKELQHSLSDEGASTSFHIKGQNYSRENLIDFPFRNRLYK